MGLERQASLAAALLLAACATPTVEEQHAIWQRYEGRPVGAITAVLGGPEDRKIVGGEEWLAWTYVSGILSCRLSAQVDGEIVRTVRAVGHQDGCRQLARLMAK